MKTTMTPRGLLLYLIGLLLTAFSAVLSTKAVLGTSPIVSVPFVVSEITQLSLGTVMLFYNLTLFVVALFIMRRNFKISYGLSLVFLVIFTTTVDILDALMAGIAPTGYLEQWICIIISVLAIGLGFALQLCPNITMMPGDFSVNVISVYSGWKYGYVKIAFDVTMIVIAVSLSLLYFGELNGVREGTIFAAIVTGTVINLFDKFFRSHGLYEWAGHVEIKIKKDE